MPEKVETELLPGIHADLDLRDATQRTTYWQGARFEYPTPQILAEWGRSGIELFFDIGANYGFFSYWMMSRCPWVHVHAFEPNPDTFALLDGIRRRNRLERLHVWNLGLGDERTRLHLHPGNEDSGHSTFGAHPQLVARNAEVEVQPLDQWVRAAGLKLPERSAWIAKIDVEGFEVRVLRGMRGVLEAKAFRGVAVEINEFTLDFCGAHPRDVFDFMAICGYRSLADGPEANRWPLRRTGNAFFVPCA